MKKLFVSMFMLCIACNDKSTLSGEEALFVRTILSETFAEKFRICDKIANDIFVYSKPEKFRGLAFSSDNFCEKTLQFSNEKIDYAIDFPYRDRNGVLLFRFVNKSSKLEFTFVQLETNRVVKFVYNNKHELITVGDVYLY